MAATVHSTAIVDTKARLAAGVEVGPYAIVGADVVIEAGTYVAPHACLMGPLFVGEDGWIGPYASLGLPPQLKGDTAGPFGETRIGARCVFREHSQVHRAMHADRETVVGDDAYVMAGAHIAHDCVLGVHVVLCNQALVAGHVVMGDRTFVSGNSVIHQFSRIGELGMVGGLTAVNRDVPPFGMVVGMRPPVLEGLNTVGLRRAGIPSAARRELRSAYKLLFRTSLPLEERLQALESAKLQSAEVGRLLEFMRSSERGVIGFGGSAVSRRREQAEVDQEPIHILYPVAKNGRSHLIRRPAPSEPWFARKRTDTG